MEKENKIRLLPEIVANQIAAGEVVDNPSSVVKEMMENSIDAGARSVTVNFRNAGLELIQIVDDGCGMSPIDARMAFDRHATSKIRDFDDVYRLQTFGFRGEALASIAAVAQVELRTRQKDDEVGTVTIVNGGEFVSQTPTMCPVGSQFFVRNLFYTAPARRKFNGDRTKMVTEIKKVFRQVALCNPQVRCELMSNDMPIITLGAGSLMERIIDVVGRHIKTNLLEVDVDTSIVKVKGYVGRPAAAKQKNTEQYLFVNGRYFRSPQIYRAILKAYEKLIPDNCSPSYFLYLTVEPDRVDVNVSPHKTEVRFADAEDVNQIVSAAVRSTLAKSGSVGMMEFEQTALDIPVMGDDTMIYAEPKVTDNVDYNPFREDYISDVEPSTPRIDDFSSAMLRASQSGGGKGSASSRAARSVSPEMDMPRLRDVAWGGLSDLDDFMMGTEPISPAATTPVEPKMSFDSFGSFASQASAEPEPSAEPEYREVSASFFGDGIDLGDLVDDEESNLEFVPAVALQQQLSVEQSLCFSDVMPLAGGLAMAVSGGRTMVVDLRRVKERLLYDGYLAMLKGGSCASQKLLFPEELILSEDDYSLLKEHEVEFAALGFDMELEGEGRVVLGGVPANVAVEQADALLYELLREVESNVDAQERMKEDLARVMAVKGSHSLSKIGRQEAQELLSRLCESENYSFSPSGKPIMAELAIDELKSKLS
ncbi:MAG: DNA mismatch repair endonuclease MutL [Alistipes sp.]|nr:DNA mismatch repair endonuclease MutL [Alistipes sp.]